MRFQTKGSPHSADGGLAQSGFGCQHAARPVGNSFRSLLQRQPHNLLDLLIANLTRCPRTRLVAQTHYPFGNETVTPKTHRKSRGAQPGGDRCVAGSARTFQDDPGAERHRPGAAGLPRQALQLDPLRRAYDQFMLLRTSTTRLHTSPSNISLLYASYL